jgi:hypothetical protein
VAAPQPLLGGRGPAGQHLDHGLVVGDRRVHPAELVEQPVALADEPAGLVQLAPHGVQQPERPQGHRGRHRVAAHLAADAVADPDRLGHRGGPEGGRRGPPAEDLEQLPLVAGAAGVLGGPPPGLVGAGGQAPGPGDPGLQAPGPALVEVVPVGLQHLEGRVRDRSRVLQLATRPRVEPHQMVLHQGPGRQPVVAAGLGVPDGLDQDAIGVGEPARLDQGDPEPGQERGPRPAAVRQQRHRPLQQAGPAREVAADQRRTGGTPEPLGGLGRQDAFWLADPPQLGPVAVGPFEVVADDLVLGAGPGPEAGHQLVELGPP